MTVTSGDGSYVNHYGRQNLTLTSPRDYGNASSHGNASRRGRSSGRSPDGRDRRDRARSYGTTGRDRSRTVDRYTCLGSYGILPVRLKYNFDGTIAKFEEHEVLLARRGGRDTYRNKPKQAEGGKGHRRDDDDERDTPLKTALWHSKHEMGWSTTRDLSQPGNHAILRLFDGPSPGQRTGQVIPNITSIDGIPGLQSEKSWRREGSAMILLEHLSLIHI